MEILAINIGEAGYKVDNFIKNYGLAFRVLLDKSTTVSSSYEVFGVPTYILIDKGGNVCFQEHSFDEKNYKDLISK